MRETHAPTVKRAVYGQDHDTDKQSLVAELSQALSRPMRLLTQSRVVLTCCILIFLVIGTLNVFLTEMSRVYRSMYNMSSAQSGNVYFGLAIGFVIASVVFGMTNDRVMHALVRRHGGETQPEYRLPATIFGMPITVIGILWYGWSLQLGAPWVVPTIGSGFAGIGITTVQVSSSRILLPREKELTPSSSP